MAVKIFINYRRDDSIGMAGRLHDRLAQTFGRDKLFMDVDHIPVGVDFVEHLNSQVAACDAILVVIGPHWLDAKDESGDRRLDKPDDFVAIEIAAALARDIRVIPVLVDGARMPRASQLPDSLKPLARRHAIEVRHAHFGHDAEALVARMREALGDKAPVAAGPKVLGDKARETGRWRVRAVAGVAAMAVLLLALWAGGTFLWNWFERGLESAEMKWQEERTAAMAEANRKVEETERQRLAALQALEQERQTRATAEAEAKRKADEAERQRLAKTEQDQARAPSEVDANRKAEAAAARAEQDHQARVAQDAEAKPKAEEGRTAKGAAEVEAKAKAEPSILILRDYAINSVAFGPDGRSALSGSDNKKVKLWDLSSGQEIRTFTGHSGRVTSVAFAPNGHTALSGSFDTTVKLWDVANGREIHTFTGHLGYVTSVVFASDGRTALSGSTRSELKLWDVSSGREIRKLVAFGVSSVALGPGGRNALYAASVASWAGLVDVADGETIRTLGKGAHSGFVTTVAFAPDGHTALTGSADNTLKLWDLSSGREIRTFTGHSGGVTSVAFPPDGRTALSGSHDKTLKLWDVATGREIRTFTGHSDWVTSVAFAPDGRSALSGSKDDTIRLWDLTSLN
jgi:hypothetical protein